MSDDRERLRAEVRDLKLLLQHPGWAVIQRDAEEQAEAMQKSTLDVVKTIEDLAYRKGVVDTLRVVANYANVVAAMEASLDASDDV